MRSYGLSNRGKVRQNNEDAFYCEDAERGIYLIADGMGGYEGGELASELAKSTAVDMLRNATSIDDALIEQIFASAEYAIKEKALSDDRLANMGTTLTFAVAENGTLKIGHIGDSRLYRIANGSIEQVTEDHTLVNALYKKGTIKFEEIDTHPNKNVLLKAVGTGHNDKPDIIDLILNETEFLLLCSDGLTCHLKDHEIIEVFERMNEPENIAKTLIEKALIKGGQDNVSVVVVRG